MNVRHASVRAVRLLAGLLLAAFATSNVSIAAPSARDIMAKADMLNRAEYEVAKMEMQLVDRGGKSIDRRLIWYFRNDGDKRTSVLKFTSPADVADVGILVKEEGGKTNAIWEYLPAVRSVRRVSAEHKRNRFMGTEFVFEDFEGLKLGLYDFTLEGMKACAATRACYVIDARPSSPEESRTTGYSHKTYWVDTEHSFIVRTELYDRSGNLEKVFASTGFQDVNGYWRPQEEIMTNLADKRETRLLILDRKIDVPFASYFTSQEYLHSES